MRPDSAAFSDSVGWAYYKLGLTGEAKMYIKKAKESGIKNAEIEEHYAVLFDEDAQ